MSLISAGGSSLRHISAILSSSSLICASYFACCAASSALACAFETFRSSSMQSKLALSTCISCLYLVVASPSARCSPSKSASCAFSSLVAASPLAARAASLSSDRFLSASAAERSIISCLLFASLCASNCANLAFTVVHSSAACVSPVCRWYICCLSLARAVWCSSSCLCTALCFPVSSAYCALNCPEPAVLAW